MIKKALDESPFKKKSEIKIISELQNKSTKKVDNIRISKPRRIPPQKKRHMKTNGAEKKRSFKVANDFKISYK